MAPCLLEMRLHHAVIRTHSSALATEVEKAVSRHLQLARRAAQPEHETGESPSYELAIRILCPFCGSSDFTAATPCCGQDVDFPPGDQNDGLMVDGHAAVEAGVAEDVGSARISRRSSRIFGARPLLLALLSSSLVGALVSQRQLANQRPEMPVISHGSAAAKQVAAAPEPAVAARAADTPPTMAPSVDRPIEQPATPPPPAMAEKAMGSAPEAPRQTAVEPSPVQRVALPPVADLGKWKTLRRGMSRAAVRALLGYPKWTDHSRNIDFWLYEENSIFGKGWVAFYDVGGPVSTWREP